LFDTWEKDCIAKAVEMQCYSLHMNQKKLTARRVKEMKAAGLHVYAYTVNNPGQAKKLEAFGVDAIFSDYPDLLSS
jgi:glycerophosphoryl diester phosphodiesterase